MLPTLGIDEAGRGPAMGPMVLAAVALSTAAARRLSRAGLRDSKRFAGEDAMAQRAALAEQVRAHATFVAVEVVPVAEIDRRVANAELNLLEREVAARLIAQAPPCRRIIADGRRLFAALAARTPGMEAHDRGEDRHAAVAAASVVAKTLRDRLFAGIAARYLAEFGELRGGGYVNDATKDFLRRYAEKYRCLPEEARTSWPHPYLAHLVPISRTGRQVDMFETLFRSPES